MSEGLKRRYEDPERRKKAADHLRRVNAERNAKVKAAWRPDDWLAKPIIWRIIGTELLSQDYISNKELGERFDSARIIECPYGETWKASLWGPEKSKRATNFVGEIRNWVRKPGGMLAQAAS